MKSDIDTRFKYALPSDYFREEQEHGHDSEQWSHKVILLLDKSIQRYSTASLAMFEVYSEMETAALFNVTVEKLQEDCRDGLFLMPLLELDGDPHWLVWELVLWQCAGCPPMHAWYCDRAMEEHLGAFRDIIWQMYARQLDASHKDCS